MNLYVVRHAIAAPRGTPGIPDNDRKLTRDGISKMKQVAAGLRSLGYVPDLILSSPLVRARQTAEILRQAFGKKIELRMVPALAPGGVRRDLYREIVSLEDRKVKNLMIVGHQPSLGEIAGEIAFGAAQSYIELKKGGFCAIELESMQGTPKGILVALLAPSILRNIKRKAPIARI